MACSKSDNVTDEVVIPKQDGQLEATKLGAEFFMTSAKTGSGINKLFRRVAELCATHQFLRNDANRITVNKDAGHALGESADARMFIDGARTTPSLSLTSNNFMRTSKENSVYVAFEGPEKKKCCR